MTVLNNLASFRITDSDIMEDTSTVAKLHSILFSPFKIDVSERFDSAISVVSVNAISRENEEIINNIKSFQFLNENWDEDNAKKISPISIRRSIDIVKRFDFLNRNVYFAGPGPNEEILLLIKENSKELELLIYPNKLKFVKFENNEFKSQGDFTMEDISELHKWAKSFERW